MSHRNTGVTEARAAVPPPSTADCPVREVLDRIGNKWSIQILIAAADGPIRFTELERSIEGISRRMLTLTLRSLERDGLLVRTVYNVMPPRVEYSLTDPARELHGAFLSLMSWAERHRSAIAVSRASYDEGLQREPAPFV